MRKLPRGFWLLLPLVLATIPVAGVFTLSRLFFVRDLALSFRSRYLFLRHSVYSGSFPFWDPYPANGQAAVNDALHQLFHLPSLAVRLLLPDAIAYNAWVALPVPLAALGMYLFLRRHVGAAAASLGAIAFAASGPMVSTTNFPNMSWSVAAVPFVFWALERLLQHRSGASAALLAFTVSCQALAGEPVTLAATLAILAGYTMFVERRWRDVRLVALVGIASAAGLLLSAIQYLPLVVASRASMRGTMVADDFWAFNPLALFELLVPHFFGDYFNSNLRQLGWMMALNSRRDPFYYTMYVGVPFVMLAGVAALSGRPRTRFWAIVVAACAIASLGSYTPLYPALQALIPPLKTFRFPVKYFSLGAFAFATLVAFALQWLIEETPDRQPRRAVRAVLIGSVVLAAASYVLIAWVLIAPRIPLNGFYRLAMWAEVLSPIQGAEFLLYRVRPLITSLLLKLICATFLLWVATSLRRERRLALVVLCAFGVVDLLASNAGVNPTIDRSLLEDPEWARLIPPEMHERIYVGGRLEGYVDVLDVDAPKYGAYIDGLNEMEQRNLIMGQMIFAPSGAKLREAISYDLPLLWPLDYARLIGLFKFAPREDRLRYLRRAGTRFVVLPTPPYPGAQPLAQLRSVEQLHLYDFNPGAQRAYVVPDALMGPDVGWQIQGMFQERFDPVKGVLVSEPPPPPSGFEGPGVPPSATFIEDGLNRVVVRAGLPADGYLVLLDSYDPDWAVEVDGSSAPLMRGNGLFRAVHLRRGTHTVTFTYHPSQFYRGAAISGVTALALVAWCLADARVRRRAAGADRSEDAQGAGGV